MPEVEELLRVVEQCERLIRTGHHLYIFSVAGHGRAAMPATCLLARLYGLTAAAALERVMRAHGARGEVRYMRELDA